MIVVQFTCQKCGLVNKPVEVRFRRADEPVASWMSHVTGMVARCHQAARPKCRAKILTDLKIPGPTSQGQGLGMDPAAFTTAVPPERKEP